MKKILLALTLLLCSTAVFAQNKKKKKETHPPTRPVIMKVSTFEEFERNQQDDEQLSRPVPASFGFNSKINAIKTNGEKITSNSFEDFDKINVSQLKHLIIKDYISDEKSLDVGILQKILNEGSQLETLEIYNLEIKYFPEIKSPTKALKKLKLSNNKLNKLHPSISNLIALEEFESDDNLLQELPETFSQLKKLEKLILSSNEFSEFPQVIFGLNKLSFLYISGDGKNKIKEIPDLFLQLPKLETFVMKFNSLSTLPKSFSKLKKLRVVYLSNNQFKDLPEALATNPNLSYVDFADNPLDWNKFILSIKKIQWKGLFSLYGIEFSKEQFEKIQKELPLIDVYYDGVND